MSKLLPVISRGMLPPWANAPHQTLTPAAETAPKILVLAIAPPSSPRKGNHLFNKYGFNLILIRCSIDGPIQR